MLIVEVAVLNAMENCVIYLMAWIWIGWIEGLREGEDLLSRLIFRN